MSLYACLSPEKTKFYSWREAKQACRRIAAQEHGRVVHAYPCADHLHLTSQVEREPERPPAEQPERLDRIRYRNQSRAYRRAA